MHANKAFDLITAPLRGTQRGLVVRTVFGRVTAFHVKDDGLAACAAVLALIQRLSAHIEASGGNKRAPLRRRCPWRAERPCGPKGPPDVRGPLQPATALRIQCATQQLR